MTFTKDSQIVKNYVLLINQDIMVIEGVPSLFNLKEVVEDVVNTKNDMEDDGNDI